MASSSDMPFGDRPVPFAPGDVLCVPGWFRDGFGVVDVPPVPIPVVELDCPPGADEIPADPGLVGVATGGGALPPPDDAPPCAAPVPPPGACAKAADVIINDIAMTADRCNLCRMVILHVACGRTNVP
ncbi:hypothetical protein [Bradyrhizobium sp. Ai1a-2]|uniref:hypothetical protein n=1 Tax=Bradyrhizobium sp. Ai1a-2 TaxID=196490 RepID=UPI0004005C3C|nr:hypothetical protein [Bradyrhizobium sp. Ai1a-2]